MHKTAPDVPLFVLSTPLTSNQFKIACNPPDPQLNMVYLKGSNIAISFFCLLEKLCFARYLNCSFASICGASGKAAFVGESTCCVLLVAQEMWGATSVAPAVYSQDLKLLTID
jgi:hypothetical protein